MQTKIITMLRLQQKLNDDTNGMGWEKGVTDKGKPIDWYRCALLECAETIDSYPWKHWKSIAADPDYANIKIEAVDIWHFVLSMALSREPHKDDKTYEALAQSFSTVPNFDAFVRGERPSRDIYEQIETIETLMRTLLCDRDLAAILQAFYDVAMQSALDLDSLYALYIGKNILNAFRQDHGYKEGTYVKVWNGKEDNEVMQAILHEHPDITPEALYEALQTHYPT